jgi:hypothetical protein
LSTPIITSKAPTGVLGDFVQSIWLQDLAAPAHGLDVRLTGVVELVINPREDHVSMPDVDGHRQPGVIVTAVPTSVRRDVAEQCSVMGVSSSRGERGRSLASW